jgi:thymidylate kinase
MLAHVHVYFRVITGQSLAKNYRLPLEQMLLQNTRELDSVRVPTQGAELVTFTVRMMLKHTALVELLLLARGRGRKLLQEEASWLTRAGSPSENGPLAESVDLARCCLPAVDSKLFAACLTALTTPTSLARRIVLGRRLRQHLRPYARHSAARAWLTGVSTYLSMLSRRLLDSKRDKAPLSGGAVIAFVGPEASGKSTLLAELSQWLGHDLAVARVHAGKPPATLLSALPNLLVPALRLLLPASRSTRVEADHATDRRERPQPGYPLLFGIRSVLLAYDRRSLLVRAFSQAANGTIVLCDRYPSLGSGAPDGPQLSHFPLPPGRSSLRRLLAQVEASLYRDIPPPDLVLQLSVPLEVAVLRNETRGKREPEDYVRLRHSLIANLDFGRTPVHRINTDRPVAETVLEVKRALWNLL